MLACPKFLPVLAVFTMIMFLSFNFLLKSTERHSGAAVFCDKQETLLSTTDNTLTANEESNSLSAAEKMFRLYDEVETFVLFIGYPRSQHSLIGAILDAHPEIIIPHEYGPFTNWNKFQSQRVSRKNLQKYMLFNELQQASEKQALFGIRANRNNTLLGQLEYTYNVPGLWQGGYDKKIKVIGDKKGGGTSKLLADTKNMKLLEQIGNTVQIPMKFIHVTRNPFDNIATIMLRRTSSREKVRGDNADKKNDSKTLDSAIDYYFRMAFANLQVKELYGDAVLDIPGHELVLRPSETLQKLCKHLGVTCSEDYVNKCSSILYSTPSVTRNTVIWTKEQKARITKMMKTVSFLKEYSFNKYPR